MDAIRPAVRKDGLGRFRQTVRFPPPAQVIRYLNDPNAEAIGDALEGCPSYKLRPAQKSRPFRVI